MKSSSKPKQLIVKDSTFYQTLAVPFEHPVTSLSISPLGREAVLAAKRGLYIIDLENPYETPWMLQHISKWDVADVQWNPHVSRNSWIASTSNQKALIWNITRQNQDTVNSSPIEFILNKHLRAISDINWSPFLPETLATCSYDAYVVHLWDLRQKPDKPTSSFCGWNAGATQVKFNRLNEWILASSHDTDVRIWDTRKGSQPTTLITGINPILTLAHMTKIYGIDWSRKNEEEILTCSQDKLVKLWNINQSRTCQATIETSSPCWRARFTPFGNGIVTMSQRKDNRLYMWNRDHHEQPVYTFEGHKDLPTEFVWRYKRDTAYASENTDEYQLVTWSKDMHLRLWPISRETAVSHPPLLFDPSDNSELSPSLPINMHSPSHQYTSVFRVSSEPQMYSTKQLESPKLDSAGSGPESLSVQGMQPRSSEVTTNKLGDPSLESELNHISVLFPGVYIDRSNIVERSCTIRLERPSDSSNPAAVSKAPVLFQVDVTFPVTYPSMPALFNIQKTWMMSMLNRTYLSSKLVQISKSFAQKGLPCLEPIIKYLLGTSGNQMPVPSIKQPSSLNSDANENNYTPEMDRTYVTATEFQANHLTNDLSPSDDSSSNEDEIVNPIAQQFYKDNYDKESNNVPFPCLCGARFSPTGKLVHFFSPLPHPASSKFTSYSLTNRNQRPVLQTESFETQPKTYPLYERYRNFVLAKCPRIQLGSNVASSQNESTSLELKIREELPNSDRRLDYWLDDEDIEEEIPSLYWRPKPSLPPQSKNIQTTDFLARLSAFNKISMIQPSNPKDGRRNSLTIPTGGEKFKKNSALSVVTTGFNPTPPSDIVHSTVSVVPPPIPMNRRKSLSAFGGRHTSETGSWSDVSDALGIPFRDKAAMSPPVNKLTFPTVKFESDSSSRMKNILGGLKMPSSLHGLSETVGETQKSIGSPKTGGVTISEEHPGYGTIVYVSSLDHLFLVNEDLAKKYILKSSSRKKTCQLNGQLAARLGKYNHERIWKMAEIIVDSFDTIVTGQKIVLNASNYSSNMAKKILYYLESQGDFQTLTILLSIFCSTNPVSKATCNVKELVLRFPKSYFTSSVALGYKGVDFRLPIEAPPFNPKSTRSKLCKSLKSPLSNSYNSYVMDKSNKTPTIPRPKYELSNSVPSSQSANMIVTLLDEQFVEQMRYQVRIYADYLYNLGLLEQRAYVLKITNTVINRTEKQRNDNRFKNHTQFQVICPCGIPLNDCPKCTSMTHTTCIICRLPCRGISTFCLRCLHGGHAKCMRKWFEVSDSVGCATGCNCECLEIS
ncbi:hypothetical protein BC833DRAFT_616326 [Globomyces pollinis-pini]|nr:hypothetical protein BC833DRAFT_616326 [Globomyces pollinis-pini]